MNLDQYISLIYKELKGEIEPTELASLVKYKNENHINQEIYNEIDKMWTGSLLSKFETENDLSQLNKMIGLNEAKIVSMWPKIFKYAGLFILLITATMFIYQRFGTDEHNYYAAEDMNFDLPDGTIVSMMKGSSITFRNNFTENRSLNLTGKAFFDVIADEEKPFTVRVEESTIEALSTEFTIDNSRKDIVVSVHEGSVRLSNKVNEAVISRNEIGIVKDKNEIEVLQMRTENFKYWINNQYRIEDEKLSDISKQLSIIFDLEIKVTKEEMNNCRVIGIYEKIDGVNILTQIAEELEMTLKEESEGQYTLLNGKCS